MKIRKNTQGFMSMLGKLCPPSKVYLALSFVGMLALFFDSKSQIGQNEANKISLFNVFFILFWTWMLDMICRSGYTNISWFFVLLPFLTMLVVIFAVLSK